MRTTLLAVTVAVVSVSCGSSFGTAEGPPQDWDHPFKGAGVQVASFDDAQALAAFPLRDPRGLGSPRIFVPASHASSDTDAVWFVYDAPEYGRIWVGESLPDIPDEAERLASYQQVVAENGQSGITSRGEMVTVRGTIWL